MGPSDVGKCLCCWSKRSRMHLHQRCISPGLFGQPCGRVMVGTATGALLGLETFSLLRLCHLPRLPCPSIMSLSTHTPVLSMPAGKCHSPAQPTQHKSRDKQYFFAFLHGSKELHPHMLMLLPKVGFDDTDLSLICILGYHLHSQSGCEMHA